VGGVGAADDGVTARFGVVGIGASAGGLEALEQFLSQVPPASGLAYVVVQHLDPDHKGMLVELLQRQCALPVAQVVDGVHLLPDHVYVIPPGYDLSLLRGVLHLTEPAAPRGLRLPIDHFLRSLAADLRDQAVGVILSGMGSDGTLGLRAIKERAGATFVQTPESAKFDGMPRSAIDAGLADVVAPAQELAQRMLAFVQHGSKLGRPLSRPADAKATVDEPNDSNGLSKVVLLLRERTGHDFSLYRKSTLVRRIERRMGLHQLARLADYVRLLREDRREHHSEAELLFQELLIGVTSFFRDPAVWDQLMAEVMPALLASRPEGGVLRAWVPGCSTGEEAYGLAMVFKEVLEQLPPRAKVTLNIFATDLDRTAIDTARNGVYPMGIAADVSEARLQRFFVEDGTSWRVSKDIREMVVFAPQNVAMDPPFTRLDLLSCRNLLIYLEPELQKKLIALFHYSLLPGGLLLLGSAETVGSADELFAPLPGKARLYRRLGGPAHAEMGVFPAATAHSRAAVAVAAAAAPPNLKQLADELLLARFAPAAVLVTSQGDILHVSGKTGRYLEPAAGRANLNLFAMAREGLNHALSEGFHRALRDQIAVTLRAVKVGTNGASIWVDVHVQPMASTGAAPGLAMVIFEDNPASSLALAAGAYDHPADAPESPLAPRLLALQKELLRAHEDLQSTREQMQASQEELKFTNEALQSANEELQSTNEELTTSKEEMQSMNEELQTVNHELVAKVDEQTHTADDLNNLLNSTQMATLFLDATLCVRRFTPAMTRLIKLIPRDVGRPITDLVSTLDYPLLADDARQVLSSLVPCERELPAHADTWYAARVMPYRTLDNRVDGLVITFADISAAKLLEATLRDAKAVLTQRVFGQNAELDAAHLLEAVLRKAQLVLEGRLTTQGTALDKANAALMTQARPGRADPS
jgi:two-component system CheB/CheR fusion protein